MAYCSECGELRRVAQCDTISINIEDVEIAKRGVELVAVRRDEYEALKEKTKHSMSLYGRAWAYGSKEDCDAFREYIEEKEELIRILQRERKLTIHTT